ncbi:hypothetical protein GobsT_30960 [Gemmata obscuriglobus]|uniref:Uncharacterized protein n=1 Tax=Gemmata obscuriglobus TaxID=114 RepID=A0A2Z3GY78_9BACT|nr:hypothetical protein [Gemmata obscuriglobus]AWM38713.1 hypothetical protein C1280_18100 [Gemmata obscuriglobus]QEG28319.1 hypothetical protein GobsT_30960 [Gemmata obscuriglobus]VTS06175.1 unnamed protein product [Gemmata obscuriglobus UQM 2246]
MLGSFSGRAGGNILPARFVKRTGVSGEAVVTQCGANESPWGIGPKGTRRMALTGWDDGFAAVAGDDVNVFGPGDDVAPLELGGTVAVGDYIKSDSVGRGVSASTDKDRVGAQALEPGVAGQLIRVKPMRFDLSV